MNEGCRFEAAALAAQARQGKKLPEATPSSKSALSQPASVLHPGETCWSVAHADRFSLIVDAADYFAAARLSMLRAERSILLVGWDFDLRIDFVLGEESAGAPTKLGAFLKHLVRRKPHLRIRILKWDMAVLYTMGVQFHSVAWICGRWNGSICGSTASILGAPLTIRRLPLSTTPSPSAAASI